MDFFSLKSNEIQNSISSLNDLEVCLRKFPDQLEQIKTELAKQITLEDNIWTYIEETMRLVEKQEKGVQSLRTGLNSIYQRYQKAEQSAVNAFADIYAGKGSAYGSDRLSGSGGAGGAGGRGYSVSDGDSETNDGNSHIYHQENGDTLIYEESLRTESKFDLENGDIGYSVEGRAESYIAKHEQEWGSDFSKLIVGGEVGHCLVYSGFEASLMKDGKLNPSFHGKVGVEGAAESGHIYSQSGTDDNNVHTSMEGTLLGGEGKLEAGAGYLGKNEEGEDVIGFKAEGGAEVYAAKGEIKSGFEIFGIRVDAKVEGKAGAIGVSGNVEASTDKIGFSGGASALLGIGVGVEIDYSDVKLPTYNDIKNTINSWLSWMH